MQLLDEYQFFAASTEKLSERRQAASQTFLTINTAIFTVVAFLVKDAGFQAWALVLVSLPLFLAGILACWIWRTILVQFRSLINWRYEQLRIMEQQVPDSFKVITKEWESFFKPKQGKERFGFSRLELWLPRLFILLYILYGIGLTIATLLGWR